MISQNSELFDFINRQSTLDTQQYIDKLSKKPPLSCFDITTNSYPTLDANRRSNAKTVEAYISKLLKYIGNLVALIKIILSKFFNLNVDKSSYKDDLKTDHFNKDKSNVSNIFVFIYLI